MSLLPDTKKVIILNAGHWDDPDTPHVEDPGATTFEVQEFEECIKVRDQLVPILEDRGYTVHVVPDDLDLKKSIAWANEKAPNLNDGLAIDIHFNWMSDTQARGTESFYGSSGTSRKIAQALVNGVAKNLQIPNRGAKPDTQTAVGSLGWIRKTTMWASLIEVAFITSAEDMGAISSPNGYKRAAAGIAEGIDKIFGYESNVEELSKFTTMELVQELQRRIDTGEL